MPAVAIAAAVVLDAGVIGAGVAGGIAAIGTLSAITAIGATVGAIGAVTHNRTLSLVGAGIGIVGAVGTLAMGSEGLGNLGDIFGSSADKVSATGAVAAANATTVTDAATTGNITNATGEVANANPAGLINSSLAAPEGNTAAIVGGGDAASPLASTISTSGANAAGASEGASGLANVPTMMQSTKDIPAYFKVMEQMNSTPATSGVMSSLLGWAHDNQTLALGVLKGGGAFISGLTNPMTQPQIDALDAQAEANRAQAALLQRQATNLGGGVPSAVTGQPTNAGGLINSRAAKPLISGVPAGTSLMTSTPVTGAPA